MIGVEETDHGTVWWLIVLVMICAPLVMIYHVGLLLPSAHSLSTWVQFMDTVMMIIIMMYHDVVLTVYM